MRVLLPVLDGRISAVLDTARQFLLVEARDNREWVRREVRIGHRQVVARARKIVELNTQVLICGAVSWPLGAILSSAGVHLIPNTCGEVQKVLEAFFSGRFTEQAFLMPGCNGSRRRMHEPKRRKEKVP